MTCPASFMGRWLSTKSLILWSERRDLNSGPPVPQTGALTGLRYAPPLYQGTSTLMSPGMQGPLPAKGGRELRSVGPLGRRPRALLGVHETELWIIDQVILVAVPSTRPNQVKQ